MTPSLTAFWHALPSGRSALIFCRCKQFFARCFVVLCIGAGVWSAFRMVKSLLSFPSLSHCSLPGRFSFFSRDKKRMQASQKNVHFQETFGEWSHSNRDDSYMEQGQEALQHLWLNPWGVWFAAVDLDSLVTRSFCKAAWQLVTITCLAHLGGCSDSPKRIPRCSLGDCLLQTGTQAL